MRQGGSVWVDADQEGISAFLVPTDTDGFEAREIKGKLGLRGQATAELSLSGVRVPADALLGEEGEGFKIAMATLDKGRMSVAAGCVRWCRSSTPTPRAGSSPARRPGASTRSSPTRRSCCGRRHHPV